MKINVNRIAAWSFLSLVMMNAAVAADTPACPSLKGSEVDMTDNGRVWYSLDPNTKLFNKGIFQTTGTNEKDANTLAEAAFITIEASGNSVRRDSPDGYHIFECSPRNNNYKLVPGITYIYVYTPILDKNNNPVAGGQNLSVPVQP